MHRMTLFVCLLIAGVVIASVGEIFNPAFVSHALRAGGDDLASLTVIKIHILRTLAISLGGVIALYSVLRITLPRIAGSALAEKIDAVGSFRNVALAGLITVLLLLSVPFLVYDALRIGHLVERVGS